MTEGLDDLRHKEECQVHRVLIEDTMSILQDQGIIIVSSLEECDSNDRWNRCPQ
jgi:hypothetical protein